MTHYTRADHFLELAVLAQLVMHAIDAGDPGDLDPASIHTWEAHRDAAVIAMLTTSGRTPTADAIDQAVKDVDRIARCALDEHTTPGRARGATGYLLPEHEREPDRVHYWRAIEAQEATLGATLRLGLPTDGPLS